MIQHNNDDQKDLSISSVGKQTDEQEKEMIIETKKLLTIEGDWLFRFFIYFLIILFSIELVFVIQIDDYKWQSINHLFISIEVLSVIILLSVMLAISRAGLNKYPLGAFVCNAFFVLCVSSFVLNSSGAFGNPKPIEVTAYVLYGLSILLVAEAIISFYSKSYLQTYLHQKGYKGYLSILGSYIVSLYLPICKIKLDKRLDKKSHLH
ncbi:hypothetical protein F9B74_05850 [Pelistega sp. NLN82]|uniref:Uncharacterized protein n=1 Tax=Pelistega ratti TaxID=2652177 RepID=A0A6L9Y7T4_9BURK|nr:hypothetical protein [Pelistega ratti]NEN75848.1 hypothetical protein [Pelistega ratti]